MAASAEEVAVLQGWHQLRTTAAGRWVRQRWRQLGLPGFRAFRVVQALQKGQWRTIEFEAGGGLLYEDDEAKLDAVRVAWDRMDDLVRRAEAADNDGVRRRDCRAALEQLDHLLRALQELTTLGGGPAIPGAPVFIVGDDGGLVEAQEALGICDRMVTLYERLPEVAEATSRFQTLRDALQNIVRLWQEIADWSHPDRRNAVTRWFLRRLDAVCGSASLWDRRVRNLATLRYR